MVFNPSNPTVIVLHLKNGTQRRTCFAGLAKPLDINPIWDDLYFYDNEVKDYRKVPLESVEKITFERVDRKV